MGRTLCAATAVNGVLTGTQFFPVGSNCLQNNTTIETSAQTPIRLAGSFSYLHFLTNNSGTGRTVRLRKNGANANLTVTLTDSTAGLYIDRTHTDAVVPGDLIDIQTVVGGNPSEASCALVWAADSGHVALDTCGLDIDFLTDNATAFCGIAGYSNIATAAEAAVQLKVRAPGSITTFFATVPGNARSSTTAVTARINAGNGTNTIAVGAGLTGIFEDFAHSDTLNDGDLVCASIATGAGAGEAFHPFSIGCTITSAAVSNDLWCALAAGTNRTAGAGNSFYAVAGWLVAATIEGNAALEHGFAVAASNLRVRVSANTYTGSATLTSRKNAAPGNMTATIGAGLTGWFEDSVNIDSVFAQDDYYCAIAGGTSGTVTLAAIGVTDTVARDPTPVDSQRIKFPKFARRLHLRGPFVGDVTPVTVDVPPPPFNIAAFAAIIASWQPPPPAPIEAQQLNASITAVEVDEPPYTHPGRDVTTDPLVAAWQPGPPQPQPLELRRINPGVPGQSVDNPPFVHPEREPGVREAVLAWQPRPPDPFEGGRQPLEPARVSPGVPGQSVNAPVPELLAAAAAVAIAWVPGPPAPIVAKQNAPGVPGQSVDPPPVRVSAALGPVILVGWLPAPPMPEPQRKVSPAVPGQSVDPPTPTAPAVEPAILVAWVPPPPAPILPKQNAPGVPGQSADQPTPFRRKESPQWWTDPPLPTLSPKLPQPTVQVDSPPFSQREESVAVLIAWIAPPPAPVVSPPRFSSPAAVVNEPPYSSRREIAITLFAAWRPPDPLPTLPARTPPASVVVAQQPPFSRDLSAALYPRDPILLPELPTRSAAAPGFSVDAPPPRSLREPPQWPEPARLPITRASLAPGIPGQSVDAPPFGPPRQLLIDIAAPTPQQPRARVIVSVALPAAGTAWLPTVVSAWLRTPPPEQRRAYFPIAPARVDAPPPFSGDRAGRPALRWWIPPDPLPTLPPKVAGFLIPALVAGARMVVTAGRVRLVETTGRARAIIATVIRRIGG